MPLELRFDIPFGVSSKVHNFRPCFFSNVQDIIFDLVTTSNSLDELILVGKSVSFLCLQNNKKIPQNLRFIKDTLFCR